MNDRLYRSVDERVIAGVCGGLAVRLALDPSLVRVLWVVVGLVTGVFPLLIIYVIMAAVVPEDPRGFAGVGPSPAQWGVAGQGDAAAQPEAGGEPDTAAAPVDATIAGAPAPTASAAPGALGAPAPTWYQGGAAPPRRRREHRDRDPLVAAVGGLVLVALGIYFLVRDQIDVDWGVVGAAGLVAAGVVVIVAALRPRR